MLVNKHATADMVMRRVADSPVVVVDVETSGLDWLRNHIIGWVLTVGPGPQDSYYIPVRHAGGGNLPADIRVPTTAEGWDGSLHPIEPRILKALEGKQIIFHHGAFDLKFMHRVGFDSRKCSFGDTMIAAFLTNELRFALSLDACCREEGVQAKKGEELYKKIAEACGCAADKSSMGMLWRMPGDMEEVWDYGAGDGTSTWQLWHVLVKNLNKPYYINSRTEFTLSKVADTEFRLLPILHRMSMRGVRVSQEKLEALTTAIKAEFEEAMNAVGDINVRSPLQVKAYFEKHGVTNWPITPKGAPSFPEEWLVTSEAGKKIVAVRKNRTLLDNFLIPMQTRWMKNGRVHTSFHQTRDEEFGTRTGRLSTTDPNLGAMPGKRQGDLGKRFRGIFIPDEGKEFGEGDFAACEIRICAHYCKAAAWVKGFVSGVDPHTSVADYIGIIRRHAKTINLALMTGTGKKSIALKLGLSLEEGSAIVDHYFRGLPELKAFQDQSKTVFEQRGFVSTLLGRRLQLADRSKGYTAVNRLTQGGNADIVKAAMVKLDELPDVETLLTVYDSALFQYEKGNKEALMKAVRTMADMEAMGINFSMPMEIEYGSGDSWGAATFNEEGKHTWYPQSFMSSQESSPQPTKEVATA